MPSLNPSFGRVAPLARFAPFLAAAAFCGAAHAATPGITGTSFSLVASEAMTTQPDGASVYSWGYGCAAGSTPDFLPKAGGANLTGANCPAMQIPAPTLIVTAGQTVTVTLTNNLPAAAGATSMLFPGFKVSVLPSTQSATTCKATTANPVGLLTTEAATGCTVTYRFVADVEGTHAYYSGTQGDLQIEMGLYGALIVLPATVPANCNAGLAADNLVAEAATGESDFRLAHAAYSHSATCYDREYLFQFSEMDQRIHRQVEEQVLADKARAAAPNGTACSLPAGCLAIDTEPYHPTYYLINGRSMPDDMDPNYAFPYPHQPYNGNPHMHPGELTLIRIIGQGRWQHPFHEHANHVRVLARDGNLLLAPAAAGTEGKLAGPLMFTTTTTPGQAMDGIFQWTGKGLNWDVYGHHNPGDNGSTDPLVDLPCYADVNGYNTGYDATSGLLTHGEVRQALNYYEWCADHEKALEKLPFGDVGAGGPMTLPDPNVLTNGAWYSGSPYLGGNATTRSMGATPIPPAGTVANSPTGEAGFAYMWHSHNEREITTDNIFPGGMMMMMLVDPRDFVINEAN